MTNGCFRQAYENGLINDEDLSQTNENIHLKRQNDTQLDLNGCTNKDDTSGHEIGFERSREPENAHGQ